MTFIATDEQRAIIDADLAPQQVIACAGSGKTATAVRRLHELRRRLGTARGYVALLSYSRVAIDTFRDEYDTQDRVSSGSPDRVVIATVDSFITTNILLPHAARTMGSTCQPYLVHGTEPFLGGFQVFNGKHPVGIQKLRATLDVHSNLVFTASASWGPSTLIESKHAQDVIGRMGELGAYTHELARYWALNTLLDQPRILSIIARRYPYVLIDEAQDVGSMHGALFGLLQEAGVVFSLIGDPHQAIYEFVDADGSFLSGFAPSGGHTVLPMTQNRRSVKSIVDVANSLVGTKSIHFRSAPARKHGAFFIRYRPTDLDKLLETFKNLLASTGYSIEEGVVLCRGNALVDQLTGGAAKVGQSATEQFVLAALARDRKGDMATAFEHALSGVLRLLSGLPPTFKRDVTDRSLEPGPKAIRRLVWQFIRQTETGIPSSALDAKTAWLAALKGRVASLLDILTKDHGIGSSATWKNNLTAAQMGDGPLLHSGLGLGNAAGLSIRSVHSAKGESIGAVLYVCKSGDLTSLLEGPATEDGRIGYVAISRARDLVLLGVPASTTDDTITVLKAKGFAEWQ